jgi:threonine/homoserine/homoserine lactone efflux protein
VNSVPLQVLLYAFVAGASPVALGATLVVLGSRGGRWNALAFAVGVVLGQTLICALAYALGTATLPVGHHPHDVARALFELVLGVALLIAGAYAWRRPADATARPDSRTRSVLERLAHLNAVEALGAGAVLALGPKRIGLTLLVTATIAGGDLGVFSAVALTGVYVVIATVLVTVPVVLAILFGARAERWMVEVEHWLSAHKRALTAYPLTVLGVVVVVDAVLGLTT